jgi:hypothetical protein
MLSLVVFDDWLDPSQLEAVASLVRAHRESRLAAGPADPAPVFSWYSPKQRCHISRLSGSHLEVASRYIDDLCRRLRPLLEFEAEGYEWWSNHGNTLDWHLDKDEALYAVDRSLRSPLWSTVFYTEVEIRGRGGELSLLCDPSQPPPYAADLTADEIPQKVHSLSPQANRLVVFRSGLRHRIQPFRGLRASLAMNVWDAAPAVFGPYAATPYCHRIDPARTESGS